MNTKIRTNLRFEIEDAQNNIARVKNSTYKIRKELGEGEHYARNLSTQADGCLSGALALYDKLLQRLDGEAS